ncbi:MAG TPA: hypothetical protein PLC42_06485, partial [Parachlamydiaceae bacterium]|nr:hypothetical protein [Parachlamydiaceae bacterium]
MNFFNKRVHFYVLAAFASMPLMTGISLAQNAQLEQPISKEKEVVRAALDIGSGATKLKVAKVNLDENKIDEVLAVENFSVQYQESLLNSKDNMFTEEIMRQGIDAIQKAKEIAMQHGAEKVVAVATASFRSGQNADAFIERIYKETGVKVHIIDQELEGILNFEAATAQVDIPKEDLIVWDIGGGSYQFTTLDQDGNIMVFRGTDASVPFRNHVITHIKRQDLPDTTKPNPTSPKQMSMTELKAREIAEKVDAAFREKIDHSNSKVVGVGNIFTYNIKPICKNAIY